MNYETNKIVEAMAENYEVLRKTFFWDHDLSKHLVALQFALEDRAIQVDEIKSIKDYLKSSTGVFSSFRGGSMFAICGLLAASSDQAMKQVDDMILNQNKLKKAGFKNSQYLPMALYALSNLNLDESLETFLNKAYDIYSEMKKNHPFLTSGDDYAFAILLASSSHGVSKIEAYYKELSAASFTKSNGLQMLSHIMAYHDGNILEQTRKLEHIYGTLKENKLRPYDKAYPGLGLISLLGDDDKNLMDFIDLIRQLKKMKRYKWLDRNMVMLLASAIISHGALSNDVSKASLQVTIQTIIAAQQAAMIAAVGAASAASAAT